MMSDMQVQIRRLRSDDEQSIAAAYRLFDADPEPGSTRKFLAEGTHHILLAYDADGTPLGFVSGIEMTHPDKGTEMFVYELGVRRKARQRGIGHILVEALAALAVERDCYGMWAVTEPENIAAQQTYRRAGARVTARLQAFEWRFPEPSDEHVSPDSPAFDAASISSSLVRPVELRDASRWAALRARLWPDANAAELAREVAAFLQRSAVPTIDAAFLVESPDAARPVGFLELSVRPFSDGCTSMPVPHIEGWYVEPSARGRGFGRALMETAVAWARANGFRELASDTSIANAPSLTAHERCGFVEVDRLIKLRRTLP